METEYKEAIKRSKIKRLNWKKILGSSLNTWVYSSCRQGYSEEQIVRETFERTRVVWKYQPELFEGFTWLEVSKNIKIGVSARVTEYHMLNKFNIGG